MKKAQQHIFIKHVKIQIVMPLVNGLSGLLTGEDIQILNDLKADQLTSLYKIYYVKGMMQRFLRSNRLSSEEITIQIVKKNTLFKQNN